MTPLAAARSIAAWRGSFADLLEEAQAYADDLVRGVDHTDDGATWITRVPRDDVRARVAEVVARWHAEGPDALPLAGVPFGVKDNIDVAGLPTTAGCPAFARVPTTSAPVVERLEAAGAVCLGKTNLDQFATGLVGTRSPYGVPRNPIDPLLVPGGSSSGSGVAVATGAVAFALGTDTAGSGRVPAAMTGIVGLKPRTGVLPSAGVIPAVASLDCVSVFARTVADADAVFAVLHGPGGGWSGYTGPVRIGVPDAASLAVLDEVDRCTWRATVTALRSAAAADGADVDVVEVDVGPFVAVGELLYGGPWVAERDVAVGAFIDEHPDAVDPVVRDTILASRRWSAADAYRARDRLQELAARCAPAWAMADVLAVPTVPRPVTIAEVRRDPVGVNAELGRFTNFVNLLGLAALAVPGATRRDGAPTGVSLLAQAGLEPTLVRAAGLLDAAPASGGGGAGRLGASGGAGRAATAGGRAADAADEGSDDAESLRPAPGRVLLAVVGAHLSGLPFNDKLTGRGGVLVARTTTAPSYRLWALTHLDPVRPALERVAAPGVAVECEVWSVDHAALGQIVAEVASPLAIGTVELASGQWVTGFVCEPGGLGDAVDISVWGGWRAWLAAASTA